MPQLTLLLNHDFCIALQLPSPTHIVSPLEKLLSMALYRFDVDGKKFNFHPHQITADFRMHSRFSAFASCVTCTSMHAIKRKTLNFNSLLPKF